VRKKIGIGLLVAAVAAVAVSGAVFAAAINGSREGEPAALVIDPGWSGSRIATELESRGIVGSALAFRLYMKLRGSTNELKAGEYQLRTEMPFAALLGELRKGPAVKFRKLTIPEGLTIEQVAAVVGESTHISAEDFLSAATPATVRPAILPEASQNLEGFLYPSTYFVIEKETAADLVRRLVGQFEKATAGVSWEEGQTLGRTPYEVLVIASLIEEESKVDEDRSMISAVIHNRLQRGMKLEIDATVQYAVRKYGKPLTESDLEVDSPYNTRRFAGIPPGPIASPRLDSIRAALTPARTDALYFVLTEDCKHHLFTADYDEFLRAKSRQRVDC
jgi:UPF0755 protein